MTKSNKRKVNCLFLLSLIFISFLPQEVVSWYAEDSVSDDLLFTNPRFSTHQWLAWEAVEMFPEAQMSWITENLYAFWHGVEAPYIGNASFPYGYTFGDYGDIDELAILFDHTGTVVIDSNLADRAEEEYLKLITELEDEESNYEKAAFYAGTLSHYISQAGIWKAIWDESKWGILNETNWLLFELAIEQGNVKTNFDIPSPVNFHFTNMSVYYNNYFNLTPTIKQANTGWQATVNLGQEIYPVVQNLTDDFDSSIIEAINWDENYYNIVKDCLTYSVEAIYAALNSAMGAVDWKYITIPDINFSYDNQTNHLNITEFEVNYYDNLLTTPSKKILTNTSATLAVAKLIYYDEFNTPTSIADESLHLEYNLVTQKWLFNKSQTWSAAALTNHSIILQFDMDHAAPTWSNISSTTFYVDYYNTTVETISSYYHSDVRTLDVFGVSAFCWDLPEIGQIDDSEVYQANWTLYQKGFGTTVTGEVFGFPVRDTEGNYMRGQLTYNASTGFWESFGNDIGLVFTSYEAEHYVVATFYLKIPVGYYYVPNSYTSYFRPFVRGQTDEYFQTRVHEITSSVPEIVFDPETNLLNAYGITAYSDYNNTELDYYELIEKPVYGSDEREARWRIFWERGIGSGITGPLSWDSVNRWWYIENISLADLPDGEYYLATKLVTMNSYNYSNVWGPPSEIVKVTSEPTAFMFSLPIFFVIGFGVIPIVVFTIKSTAAKRKSTQQVKLDEKRKGEERNGTD